MTRGDEKQSGVIEALQPTPTWRPYLPMHAISLLPNHLLSLPPLSPSTTTCTAHHQRQTCNNSPPQSSTKYSSSQSLYPTRERPKTNHISPPSLQIIRPYAYPAPSHHPKSSPPTPSCLSSAYNPNNRINILSCFCFTIFFCIFKWILLLQFIIRLFISSRLPHCCPIARQSPSPPLPMQFPNTPAAGR